MKLSDRLTILVPTFNRPADLKRLVDYLSQAPAPPAIVVLDSSARNVRAANAKAIAGAGAGILHREFDQEIQPFDKFLAGAESVTTPFAMLCADDDIVFVDQLETLVAALEVESDAVAAHGRYLGFTAGSTIDVERVIYDAPSVTGGSAAMRIARLLDRYEATTYALHRTAALRRALAAAATAPSMLFRELLGGLTAAAEGSILRLPEFSHARNLGPSGRYERWQPLEFAFRAPGDLIMEYAHARSLLAGRLPNVSRDAAMRVIDLAHLNYFVQYAPAAALAAAARLAIAGTPAEWAVPALQVALHSSSHPWIDAVRQHRVVRAMLDSRLGGAVRRKLRLRPSAAVQLGRCRFSQDFLDRARLGSKELRRLADELGAAG